MSTNTEDINELDMNKEVTFILFSTQQKLTLAELKKIFRVKKGKLFKIRNDMYELGKLFEAIQLIKNSIPNDDKFFNFDGIQNVTHIYVVKSKTCTKDFAAMKFGNELIGGYDIKRSDLEILKEIRNKYVKATSKCSHAIHIIRDLKNHTLNISKANINLSIQLNQMVDLLRSSFYEFAKPDMEKWKKEIVQWHEKHRWEDIYSKAESINDPTEKLAA